ncbi:unnamed protein product [Rotaria magnacalcarata]|uniref:Uncharacterized protein n=1 Tax=Rotaria magnacalcarata TaxID=392030 RepID=A0A820F3Z6_9BILA|nr:unnamed protein product [Rotaria magnacalcarata]CAF3847182.1 unnamed protein product [Rotaria magnacalcarata]CAF4255524.1 unnamed protein product [Rotaria magnacalcarata]
MRSKWGTVGNPARHAAIFGDTIHWLHIDRNNSTLNIERRYLECSQYKYYVSYIFTSRVWNPQVNNLVPSIEKHDFIIFESFIWDVTRYNDSAGDIYLQQFDLCLSKLRQLKKHIIWVLLPPPVSTKAQYTNELLKKLSPLIIEKIHKHSITLLNLYECFKNDMNIRNKDGVHFTPYGHCLITVKLADCLQDVQKQQLVFTTDDHHSSSNNSLVPEKNTSDLNEAFYPTFKPNHNKRNSFNTRKLFSRNDYARKKRIFDTVEAENFGLAFGIAWKTFRSVQ